MIERDEEMESIMPEVLLIHLKGMIESTNWRHFRKSEYRINTPQRYDRKNLLKIKLYARYILIHLKGMIERH